MGIKRIDRALSDLGEPKCGGSMNKSNWVGASCRTALVGLAMTSCGAGSIAAELLAPHGALPMAQQQQRLDELVSGLGSPPPGIDPTAWTTIYVPVGNELTPDRVALGRKLYFDVR